MGYISKSYLQTQFTNFATRLSLVFAKKTDIPTTISDIDCNTETAEIVGMELSKETVTAYNNSATGTALNGVSKITGTSIEQPWGSTSYLTLSGLIQIGKLFGNWYPGTAANFSPSCVPYVTLGSGLSPSGDGAFSLGNSNYKWAQLYAKTATINTSDRNLKDNIKELDNKWIEFFMKLQPVSFTFKDGESGRTHIGFISQDVEKAMNECGMESIDFAGFCKDQLTKKVEVEEEIEFPATDETPEHIEVIRKEVEEPVFDENGEPVYIYALRYEEFIALNTMVCQKLISEVETVKDKLSKLEERIGN